MSHDLYLDPDTHDLPEISRIIDGLDLVRQRIRVRLERGTGEWFLDPDGTGLPFLEWVSTKPVDVAAIASRVRQEVEAVPGVVRTTGFEGELSGRELTIEGEVFTEDGRSLALTVAADPELGGNVMPFAILFGAC